MMELRWLGLSSGHRVLQYRVREREVRSTMAANGNPGWVTEHTWTDWCDVPTVLCSTEGGVRTILERAK
jgi:hypothetical protein